MRTIFRPALIALLLLVLFSGSVEAAPEGTLTWGLHVTLASKWLDPADTEAFINPFMVLYAIHDALVKPMPAGDNTPSLAESWTVSKDGLTYEFVLRKGVKFHNGDVVTAEDVQQIMHDRILHVPIFELAFLWGVGPRVEESCVDHIKGFSYSAPYEDLKIKGGR